MTLQSKRMKNPSLYIYESNIDLNNFQALLYMLKTSFIAERDFIRKNAPLFAGLARFLNVFPRIESCEFLFGGESEFSLDFVQTQ